jgi:hypothetical protein
MPSKLGSTFQKKKIKKNCVCCSDLKGHSHKEVFEIISLNDRLDLNQGKPTLFKINRRIVTIFKKMLLSM